MLDLKQVSGLGTVSRHPRGWPAEAIWHVRLLRTDNYCLVLSLCCHSRKKGTFFCILHMSVPVHLSISTSNHWPILRFVTRVSPG